jgi:hypothetical protein
MLLLRSYQCRGLMLRSTQRAHADNCLCGGVWSAWGAGDSPAGTGAPGASCGVPTSLAGIAGLHASLRPNFFTHAEVRLRFAPCNSRARLSTSSFVTESPDSSSATSRQSQATLGIGRLALQLRGLNYSRVRNSARRLMRIASGCCGFGSCTRPA